MIESWKQQTLPCSLKLSISISGECQSFNDELIKQWIEGWNSCSNLSISLSYNRSSQFEHYKFLCKKVNPFVPNLWFLFTDDDDLWHPNRVETYQKKLRELLLKHPEAETLILLGSILSPAEVTPEDIDSVDKVIKKYGNAGSSNHDGEYVSMIIESFHFQQFLCRCSDKLIKSWICDRALYKYCRHNNPKGYTLDLGLDWLYFHRKKAKLVTTNDKNMIQNLQVVASATWEPITVDRFIDYMKGVYLKNNISFDEGECYIKEHFVRWVQEGEIEVLSNSPQYST